MKQYILWLALAISASAIAQTLPANLVITPERSNFEKTSTHRDVMDFIEAVKARSQDIQVFSMGKSQEGKDIPVVVMARPRVQTPEEAKASGKMIVYIQGNIHAGEVEGKEALLMLMRDILLGDKQHLLENQIILFAPIYNTDSNDKMEKGRRPSQEDSPLEVGIRENSQGLDLNRDGVKMEAFETNHLFQNVVVPWDPQVFIDLHTTNGTWHAWNLTWAPSYHYAGERGPYDYTVDTMLKSITETVKQKYDLNFGPYGDYDVRQGWPPKNFYTYNHHPRYLVNQFSLRNRIAILSEAFSHERFYQRIHSTYAFVNEILTYTKTHGDEIRAVNKKAEQQTMSQIASQAGRVKKGVRFKMVPLQTLPELPTYDYVVTTKADGSPDYLRTGNIIRAKDVTYYAKFDAEIESNLPKGYVIPAEFSAVAENLRKHGVVVTTLGQSKSFEGEVFLVDKYEKAARKFEGHFMGKVQGSFSSARKKFSKGDYIVNLAQPLGNLAFYLLEPQSDDGYVTWNFFDGPLEKQADNKKVEYPVFKYY